VTACTAAGDPVVVVNVTVAVRADAVVFACAVNITDALPSPDPGETVTHD